MQFITNKIGLGRKEIIEFYSLTNRKTVLIVTRFFINSHFAKLEHNINYVPFLIYNLEHELEQNFELALQNSCSKWLPDRVSQS